MTFTHKLIASGIIAFLAASLVYLWIQQQPAYGSTVTGSEYYATSTAGSSVYGAVTVSHVVKIGFGSLAQVTIEGANTGIVNLYDATTSNVALRTGQKATP